MICDDRDDRVSSASTAGGEEETCKEGAGCSDDDSASGGGRQEQGREGQEQEQEQEQYTESDIEPDIDERNITFRTPTTASHPDHPPPLERNTTTTTIDTTTIVDLSREYRTFEPEDILPQPDNHENMEISDSGDSYTSEEYQEYIQFKKKPRLKTKCFSVKDGRDKLTECAICFEEHSLRNTLTFGCGHEFCKECSCDHFHFSVTNQPYNRHYACPTCRADVKTVRVNYSKLDAKNKQEVLDNDDLTYDIKLYC
jgi:hypothetical protein